MNDRIALLPTEEDMNYWMDAFIPSPELWWWDVSDIPFESRAMRVIPRDDHRNDEIAGDIRWVNAYLAWQMTPATTRVVVDKGGWFAGLNVEHRRKARELQVELRRGKCVPLDRFGGEADIPDVVIVGDSIVLDRAMWQSLRTSTKRMVLQHELADWDRATSFSVPESAPAHVMDIANRFVHQEGINCLAVTSYAITANQDDLLQWMMPDSFENILGTYGYSDIGFTSVKSGDAVVFRNISDDIVHAAFALTPDRFLNKSGQTSFNPIAILNLQELKEDWAEFTMSVLRRQPES